ncbi:MAG: class I SAM-dependent methyltransferase [Verrucomicrobiales bacterium]|nr:class I SAM-dependent methyltransferase [Verrucomicrobiales bacterium]
MSCLICGGNATRPVVRAPDFEYQCRPGEWSLVECTGCGHVFVDPLPAVEEVPALYPPGYYTVNPGSPIYMEGAVVEAKMVKDAEQLRRRLGTRPIRSVVDIGGGNLTRLIKLREVFEREGGGPVAAACLDLQFDAAVRQQAEAAGLRCVLGNVETDLEALPDGGQDLIVMRQLLEHLRDPRAALRQLHRKLSPHGVLVIDTPNRGGWDYRLFRRRYWGGYHIPRHFHLFDLASLARLLRETGYAIEAQGCTPSIAFWIISFRNALGLNSLARGSSLAEFLNLKNLPVVGGFFVLDLIWSKLGGQTSNQFALAIRADAAGPSRPGVPSAAPGKDPAPGP